MEPILALGIGLVMGWAIARMLGWKESPKARKLVAAWVGRADREDLGRMVFLAAVEIKEEAHRLLLEERARRGGPPIL